MADYTLSAKVTGDAKGFNRAFESAQESLERLAEKTKELGTKISDLGKKLSSTITPALSALGAGAMLVASEFESSNARIQNSLGITEEKALEMSKVARDIYNRGFGESLPDVERALIQIKQNMKDLTNRELSGVIVKAQLLGETFDADVNEVTRAGNNIMKAFGTTSSKAFDLMANGAQNGLNFSNELFDNLSEYAPLFGKMGFSAEEYFQLLQKGAAAGVYNLDYINDVMKEFQIRVKDGSKATTEAMALMSKSTQKVWTDFLAGKGTVKDVSNAVLGELKSMDDQVMANNIGVALYGTKWEDLEADAMYALGGIDGKLGEFEGTMDKMVAVQEKTFGQQFQSMLRNVKAALVPVGTVLNDLASKVLPKISSATQMASEAFSGMSTKSQKIVVIVGILVAALGPLLIILGTAVTFIGVIGTGLAALVSPIGLIIAAIAALSASLGYQMVKSEEFRNTMFSVFDAVRAKVQSVVDYLVPIFQSLYDTVTPIFKSISSKLVEAFSNSGPAVLSGLGKIASQIGTVFKTIWGIVESVIPIFTTLFSSLIDGFKSAGGVGSGFGIQLGTILLGLSPIVKGIILLFQNFGPQIVTAFQDIVTMILPVVSSLGTALGQLASAVIPIFMQALATLIPVAVQLGLTIKAIVEAVLPIMISLFTQMVPIITQIVLIFADIIAQIIPLVGVLISSLLPVISSLIISFMNIYQTTAPALIAIIGAVIEVFKAILPIIMSVLTVVVHVFAGIISVIGPIVAFVAGIINAIMAVIAPIVTFIANIIAMIASVIRPIIVTVTGIFNTVFTVVSGTFRTITNYISTSINSISSIISKLSSTVSTVFNSIKNTITTIMNTVSKTISGVFSAIGTAWNGLTSIVNGIFTGISTSISKLVNQIKGFINGVISGINSAIGLINKLPGVSVSKIPQLARGTDDWQGGFALMNEGGRGELVNLPNGSQVIPHDVSMKYAREAAKNTPTSDDNNSQPMYGGITQHVVINSPRPLSPSEIARKNKQAARELAYEWGLA